MPILPPPFFRRIVTFLVLFACAPAVAGDYPPLPTVERSRLSDAELFDKLNAAHPGMKRILDLRDSDGLPAATAALADHFRERAMPRWWIDALSRPRHDSRPDGVNTSQADLVVRHVYRSFNFGPDIDWLDHPTYAPVPRNEVDQFNHGF